MKGYWPINANGAILITSRTYHNFLKDINRKGETVQMFSPNESWDLLLRLLGDDWVTAHQNKTIKQADELAAKAWLKLLGGLRKLFFGAQNSLTNLQLFQSKRLRLSSSIKVAKTGASWKPLIDLSSAMQTCQNVSAVIDLNLLRP